MSRGYNMNSDFPRIVTLLRKERGLSQKQAALELGVSQALLSHYEKGIRECGLDFVVRIADYYNVSCDYLLGRSADRQGATLSIDEVNIDSSQQKQSKDLKSGAMITLNKRLVINSLNIIFELLEQADCRGLTAEISSYLMVSVYKMIRTIYSSNPKNPQAMFSIMPEIYSGLSTALQSINEANARCLSNGKNVGNTAGANISLISPLSPEIISQKYPDLAPSLYNLIQKTEEKMKNISQ